MIRQAAHTASSAARIAGRAAVALFSMFVPFFGIASAALLIGGRIHPIETGGGLPGLVRARPAGTGPLVRVGA